MNNTATVEADAKNLALAAPSTTGFIKSVQGLIVKDFPRSKQGRKWVEASKEEARAQFIANGVPDETLAKWGLKPRDKPRDKASASKEPEAKEPADPDDAALADLAKAAPETETKTETKTDTKTETKQAPRPAPKQAAASKAG